MKLEQALAEGKKILVSLSGGKDSTALALLLVDRGVEVAEFLFCDTGLEYPEIYDALDRFEETTGRKITRLRREDGKDFLYFAAHKPIKARSALRRDGTPRRTRGHGWPNPMLRFCTRELKLDVLAKYKRDHYKTGEYVEAVGIAADEPKRIHAENPLTVYPLVEWGITEADAFALCKARGFYPSPCAYDDCKRVSCFACPLSNLDKIRYLIGKRPELWSRIKEMEKEIGEPWMKLRSNGLGTAYFEKRFAEDGLMPHKGGQKK